MSKQCVLCKTDMIAIIGDVDDEVTRYCEHCGVDEKTAKDIKYSEKAMTVEELELLVKTVIMTRGRYGDIATKVLVDGTDVGNLGNFLQTARDTGSLYVFSSGQVIGKGFTINNNDIWTVLLYTLSRRY